MPNVIELENDIYYEVDEDALFDQGVIKLNTDLHPDHTEEALVDILFVKHLLDDNDEIVDLYLKVLEDIGESYNEVTKHLYNNGFISMNDRNLKPHQLLDIDFIKSGLRYLGGYPTFFKLLGYKIVELNDTYAIVAEDIDNDLIEDYTYGYHYYVVTLYQNGKKVESIHNVHIRNEDDLINFVNGQFNLLTEFYLVNSPLTSRNFESIPKVNKIIENYRFEPINEIISDYHLSHIDEITFYAMHQPKISISGNDITTLEINGKETFSGHHNTNYAKSLFIQIDNIDQESSVLIDSLIYHETLRQTDHFEIKYLNGSTHMFLIKDDYRVRTFTPNHSMLTIQTVEK